MNSLKISFKPLFISFMVIALFAVSSIAQPPKGEGECPGHKKGKHHMMQELNLTEEQKTKLQELRVEHKPAMVKVKETMKLIKQKSKAELMKDKPDKAVLKKYSQESANQHRLMADEMINHLLKVKKNLNKEQFEKMLSKEFFHGAGKHKMGGQRKGNPHCK